MGSEGVSDEIPDEMKRVFLVEGEEERGVACDWSVSALSLCGKWGLYGAECLFTLGNYAPGSDPKDLSDEIMMTASFGEKLLN